MAPRHRVLTPDQAAARDERRARFAELARKVAAMTDADRANLAGNLPAITTIEGHTLSMHNSILLWMQTPAATVVGGFNQWRAAGRMVRKGEHGAQIWAPRAKAKTDDDGADTDRVRFLMITVFDVSQTEAAA